MKKFILLGMTALALVFSQNSNATDFITTPKLQQELNQAVQHLDSKGFLKSKIDVLIERTQGLDRIDGSDFVKNEADFEDPLKCSITLTFSKLGQNVYAGHSKELKEITKIQNDEERQLSNNFYLYHEINHCNFSNKKEIFLIDGQPELQKKVNYYFMNMSGSHLNDSLTEIMHENFADTMAAIQLIKTHGYNQATSSLLNKIAIERYETGFNYINSENRIESHNTYLSLKEILKTENIDFIIKESDNNKLELFAQKIANKSVYTLANTYIEQFDSLFDYSNFKESMFKSVHYNLMLENKGISSQTNGFFQSIAKSENITLNKNIKDYNMEDLTKIRVASFQLLDKNMSKEQSKIDETLKQWGKYIQTNFATTTDFNSHIDINHIREQTKEQLKEESFSIEKVSLNIQKIRDKQQLQNTSIKKIKI